MELFDPEPRSFPLWRDLELGFEPEQVPGQLVHQYLPESGFIVSGFGWIGHGVRDGPQQGNFIKDVIRELWEDHHTFGQIIETDRESPPGGKVYDIASFTVALVYFVDGNSFDTSC